MIFLKGKMGRDTHTWNSEKILTSKRTAEGKRQAESVDKQNKLWQG